MDAGGDIYSNKEADELSNHYGLDISEKMASMLSDQLAKEIDKEILRSLGLIPEKNLRRIDKINRIFKNPN